MKRNIKVNIFGSLYPMDEDAYAMLNAYIVNMREYFSGVEDGKEIADDIEARAAELMSELIGSGAEAISIEHVGDIIERIGNPEQMSCEDSCGSADVKAERDYDSDRTEAGGDSHKRKLYRDPEHRILGGVCAGLGNYLGVNPLWLRILLLVLVVPTYGVVAALYFLFWFLLPVACTPADRLRMKGKTVNFSNICEEFLQSARDVIDRNGSFGLDHHKVSRSFVSLFKWIAGAFGVLLLICCGMALLAMIFCVICAVSAPWADMKELLGENFPVLMVVDSNPLWLLSVCCASLLVILVIMLFCIVHFIFHILGKADAMRSRSRISCVVVWALALVTFLVTFSNVVSNVGIKHPPYRMSDEEWRQREKEREARHEARQRESLAAAGWRLMKARNVNDTYILNGEHYSGNENAGYLDASASNGSVGMVYEAARVNKVAPGIYRLRAAARANGSGAVIFAVNGKGERRTVAVPACGNKGGTIWRDAVAALEADSAGTRPDRDYLKGIVKANKSRGYGWSVVEIDNIVVGNDSVVRYGVTTDSPESTWDGTWLSATGFELSK